MCFLQKHSTTTYWESQYFWSIAQRIYLGVILGVHKKCGYFDSKTIFWISHFKDDGSICNAQGYWYCDQTMTCCGLQTLFRGCGKIMCDEHCSKQYGDQYNQRITNWHCTDEDCADRFYEGQKKCCLIAFFFFVASFILVSMWSFSTSDTYEQEMGHTD